VLGITQQPEAKLEQGVCNVSLVQLWKITQHYDVPLETFLDEQGPLRMEKLIPGDLSAGVDARHKLRVEVAQATRGVTTAMLEAVLKVLQAAQKEGIDGLASMPNRSILTAVGIIFRMPISCRYRYCPGRGSCG
jgi:transcriptional regulator with XRE-family HTH domain